MKDWGGFFQQIKMLLEAGQDEIRITSDEVLVNIVVQNKEEHEIIISFDAVSGKMYHMSAHPR